MVFLLSVLLVIANWFFSKLLVFWPLNLVRGWETVQHTLIVLLLVALFSWSFRD
ncbi:MAG: hypothetical protein AAGG02_03140 [Cyanobacteria bacterium P01_H01_bin.15]